MGAAKKTWPTAWPSSRAPCFPVTMETTRDETGIDYRVTVDDGGITAHVVTVWSTRRDFGQQTVTLAGGAAFRDAAYRQQKIADDWAAAIAVPP